MSDTEKSAVFKVSIEFGDFEKNQEEIKKRIADLRNEQLKLDVSTKGNQKTFSENQKTLSALEKQLKINEKTLNEFTKAEQVSTDKTNFSSNSIKQNRELLKTLTAEYIRVKNPTKEATDNIKKLSDTLKKQEGAIGDTRRNVGNYGESFKGVISQFPAFSQGIGQASNGFKALAAGNPFTLILLAITTIVQKLLAIEPIANAVGGIFNGITATFTTLATSVKDFFNLFSSGGGFVDSFSKAFGGLSGKIAESATNAFNLVKALDDLEDAERAQQARSAQTNRDVAILIAQSKDRTKSEAERIAILEKANDLEEAQIQRDLKLSNLRVSVLAAELSNVIRNGGDRDKAEQDLADAQQKRFEGQQAFGVQTEKNIGRINGLKEAEIAIEEKATAKKQAASDRANAIEEKRIATIKKNAEDARKFFEDTTKIEFENALKSTENFYKQKGLLLKQDYASGTITQEQFLQKNVENETAMLESKLIVLNDYSENVKNLDVKIAENKTEQETVSTNEQLRLAEILKQTKIDDANYFLENQILESNSFADAQNLRIEQLKSANQKILLDTTISEEKKKNIIAKNNQAIVLIERTTKQARLDTLNQVADTFTNLAKIAGASTEAGKVFSIASTLISTYTSAQAAFASQFLPIPTPSSPIRGAIAAAAAVATGLRNVQTIRAVNIPGFAEGGVVSGKRISESDGEPIQRSNGDNRLVTVKTNEVILNERQQMALGGPQTFASIGVPGFASGGLVDVPGFARGGVVEATIRLVELQNTKDNQLLIEAIKNIDIYVSVTEINEVNATLTRQVKVAQI